MPADPRFTIRGFRNGDEAAILDLFARSFPHAPRSLERWQWEYQRSPFGNERISLGIDADDRLVAHYAGYPVFFRDDDRDRLAHQIGDTMTDPAVRHVGRGPTSLLGRTALHFYETFCEAKASFNFGFNVANIQKFSIRFLRAHAVEPVTYRVRDAQSLRPIARVERWMRGYRLERVTSTSPEWDALFARVAQHYGFLIRRDAAYVRWRYLECPESSYVVIAIRKWHTLVGWIVYRIRDDRFTIGDALFDLEFPDAFDVLLRHVVPPHRVATIEGWFPPRPLWFDRILNELGFVTRPEPQDLSLMCVPFAQTDAVAHIREGLYYTAGDGDLF
ncbi:MAG TPA: GNAT family N-acetyltransferase [Thermoanaerobaculia bacterium]|nr:GNAT family N-acetyltransferase [Thermoanaerobaculia bacterium]